jgi:hypothetical protein
MSEDAKDNARLAAFENQEWYFDLNKLRVSSKHNTILLLKCCSIWMPTAWL